MIQVKGQEYGWGTWRKMLIHKYLISLSLSSSLFLSETTMMCSLCPPQGSNQRTHYKKTHCKTRLCDCLGIMLTGLPSSLTAVWTPECAALSLGPVSGSCLWILGEVQPTPGSMARRTLWSPFSAHLWLPPTAPSLSLWGVSLSDLPCLPCRWVKDVP